jgi:hypothetical protein
VWLREEVESSRVDRNERGRRRLMSKMLKVSWDMLTEEKRVYAGGQDSSGVACEARGVQASAACGRRGGREKCSVGLLLAAGGALVLGELAELHLDNRRGGFFC